MYNSNDLIEKTDVLTILLCFIVFLKKQNNSQNIYLFKKNVYRKAFKNIVFI